MKACSTDVAQWADICMRCHSSVGPDIVEDAEERLHSKLEARTAIQSCVWKEVWVSSTVLMQNRGKGACSINHIPVADTGDGVTCFRFNSDQILIGTRLHNLRLLPTLKSNSQGLDRQINFKPKHDSAIICASFISSISSIAASGDSAGRLRVWNTFTGKMIAELPNAHTNGVSSLFLTDKSRFFPNEAKVEEGDNSGIVIVTTGFDCLIQAYLLQFGGRALVGPIRRMQKRKSTINLTGKSVLIPVTDSTKGKDKQACKASYTPAPFASKTVGERLSSIIRPIQRTPGGQLLRPHEACSTSSPRTSSTNFKGMMDGLHFPKRKSETKEPAPPAPVISSLATWKGHSGHVYCVTMLTCGTKLASGGLDHSVRIWSIKHTDCILTLKGHYDTVTCVHAIKHFLFSGSLDKTIRKWDTRTGQTENVIGPSSAWVRCLDSNDKWLVSGGGDETIKVWDIESGTMIHHFILNRGPIVALQVDDRKIVTACRGRGYENQITVLDFSDRDAPFLSYCKRRKSSTKVVDVVRGSQETIANDVGKLETCEITDYQPCIEGFSSESGSSDMDGEEIEVWEDAPSVDDQ
ncbi:hypothetical protein BC830DRAFT_623770 [Chytriomyces sp. MP71]|nr:hypothetical protein BC830DRAFT_643030 [Chytriomyces sp. MP71]KAI8611872.1 hypothetical protein BC830DRAFT_623770 [Chytriomyces sp. MP71]